jgi:cell division transport system permease protein
MKTAARPARKAPSPEPPAAREPARSPLVPPQTIAGRALVLVIAIMTFLAGLTITGVSVVGDAAHAWRSDIGREVTIEIRPIDGADINAEIQKAVALAQEFQGVSGARGLTDAETQRLLEPWLGAGIDLGSLPVPRLVVVSLDDPARFDVKALAEAVAKGVRGGSVDDHALWVDRLAAMANSTVVAGLGILVLVLTALVLSVVFATRAAMAGNRDVIEVLHFCGAEDRFIAGEFQRHFLLLGMKGGAIGGVMSIALVAFLAYLMRGAAGRPGADQVEALIGMPTISLPTYGFVLLLVVAIAVLTAATSRFAVRRSLAAIT